MLENIPIKVIETFDEEEDSHISDMKIVTLELYISGEPVCLRIGVADRPAKLADIVPLARVISSKITRIIVEKKRREGIDITCRKGCWSCCHHLVPLSVPEVLRLADEISSRPDPNSSEIK